MVGSPWGRLAPEPFFDKKTKIYHVALKKEYRSPFLPYDELHPKDESKDKDKTAAPKKKKPPTPDEPTKAGVNGAQPPQGQTMPPPVQPKQVPPSPQTQPAQTQPAQSQPTQSQPQSQPAQTSPAESQPAETAKIVPVEIELDGLQTRLLEVPLPAGNYNVLSVTEKRLFWLNSTAERDATPELMTADIANKDVKPKELVKGATAYELSADRKSLLVRKKDAMFIIDASANAPAPLEEKAIDLSGWSFPLIPREEWRQMFTEAWRLERDYFYDRNMLNVDWKAMLERYRPMVDRVSTRAELSDLISQMVAELSTLHTFVYGGELRQGDDKINPASLGALLARDEQAGGYRIVRIFKNDPDQPELTAPLARQGVDVKEGQIIEQINGQSTLSVPDPEVLLRNKAGKQVLLTMKSLPGTGAGAGAATLPGRGRGGGGNGTRCPSGCGPFERWPAGDRGSHHDGSRS